MEAAKFVASIYVGGRGTSIPLAQLGSRYLYLTYPKFTLPTYPYAYKNWTKGIENLLDIIFYLSNIKFLCEFPPWQSLLN